MVIRTIHGIEVQGGLLLGWKDRYHSKPSHNVIVLPTQSIRSLLAGSLFCPCHKQDVHYYCTNRRQTVSSQKIPHSHRKTVVLHARRRHERPLSRASWCELRAQLVVSSRLAASFLFACTLVRTASLLVRPQYASSVLTVGCRKRKRKKGTESKATA